MTSPLDTFTSSDIKELLSEKYILILGDTVVRNLYKDLIKLYNADSLLTENDLRQRGEKRFYGDQLIHDDSQKGQKNSNRYDEVREFTARGRLRMRYYFLGVAYSSYIKDNILSEIENQTIKPDVILMNSCLWDLSRMDNDGMKLYRTNVNLLMGTFRQLFPQSMIAWLSALPVSNSTIGGPLMASTEYLRPILPGLIRDGNYFCAQLCNAHSILHIDLHKLLSPMTHLRQSDGIHWSPIGCRIINEIILNHIKAFYSGVKTFQCRVLRSDLENRINTHKQQMNNHSSTVDDRCRNICDDEKNDHSAILKKSSDLPVNLKRKRNDDESEKENQQLTTVKVVKIEAQQRNMIDKKSVVDPAGNYSKPTKVSSIDSRKINQPLKTNQSSDTLTKVQDNTKIIDSSVPLVNCKEEKCDVKERDFIVLSSDDEEQFDRVLPIYLLIRH